MLITIADTGPGIDPKVAEKIFQPFFTTKPSGMGIGLSICKSIIEAHEGRLTATPGEPCGTVFQIYLPNADANADERLAEPKLDQIEFVDTIRWSLSGGGRSKGVMPSGFSIPAWRRKQSSANSSPRACSLLRGKIQGNSPFSVLR